MGLRTNTFYAFLERFSVENLLQDLKSSESVLTGLSNRLHLEEYVSSDIRRGFEGNREMLFLRIVNISSINMNYEYDFGDQVLGGISSRLKKFQKEGCVLIHFTADQFIAYRKKPNDLEAMDAFVAQMMTALTDPFP